MCCGLGGANKWLESVQIAERENSIACSSFTLHACVEHTVCVRHEPMQGTTGWRDRERLFGGHVSLDVEGED